MHDEMQPLEPQEPAIPSPEHDNEGAVAKADLYKLAKYSMKLFKDMQDDTVLEAWVQAKITKAADYIASVYHYLEYEMKFTEYGHHLDNSDTLSESQRAELKNKLMEAKKQVANLKKQQAEKLKDKDVKEGQEDLKKTGDSYKTSKGGTVTKTSTGVKHERDPDSYDDGGDEIESNAKSGKGVKSHAKSKSAAEKKAEAPKLKKSKTGTWGMENGEKFDNRKKEKAVAEGKKDKPDYIDLDKDGDKKEPMKKAAKEKKVDEGKKMCTECDMPVAECSCSKVEEGKKPSAGLTKKEKSAVVKKAKKGGDIGKPGKNFDKVAKAAGGGEKGKKIAAAAMWKNIKESIAQAVKEGNMSDQQYKDALDKIRRENPQALAAALNSKDPNALNKLVGFKLSPGEKTTPMVSDPEGVPMKKEAQSPFPSRNKPADQAPAEPTKVQSAVFPSRNVNESAELDRMKEFLTRLNG